MIDSKTKLCCIIGNPVEHSFSPQMHNSGYKALGLNFVFLAFKVTNVEEAIFGLKALGARGIVVTIPHKRAVIKYVDQLDKTALSIGAVNTIINDNGILKATNTDWIGALEALEEKTEVVHKTVALLGAGGAARAVAYALKKRSTKVNVFNRTKEHAEKLVNEFKLSAAYGLDDIGKIANSDIIVNTTSVGMKPIDDSPIPIDCIRPKHIVFDIVYTPRETRLIRLAKKVGATVVYGDKMVLYGGVRQFELFTGKKAPVDIMRKALLLC